LAGALKGGRGGGAPANPELPLQPRGHHFFIVVDIIQTENGYGFLSMERRVIYFFVHLQEDFETFHPST
jgi:hypothetical protein